MEQSIQSISWSINCFGLRLLQAFAHDGEPQNIFFSPFGISMCLTIASNAANNQTRQEMLQAMCLAEICLDEINRANLYLIHQFNLNEGVSGNEPELQPTSEDIFSIRKRHIPRDEMDKAHRVL